MKNVDTISAHDQEAAQYDQQVREYNSFDILKTQKLLIRGGPEEDSDDMLFKVYVAREASVEHI